jgi:hypothetical protein
VHATWGASNAQSKNDQLDRLIIAVATAPEAPASHMPALAPHKSGLASKEPSHDCSAICDRDSGRRANEQVHNTESQEPKNRNGNGRSRPQHERLRNGYKYKGHGHAAGSGYDAAPTSKDQSGRFPNHAPEMFSHHTNNLCFNNTA